MSAERIPAEALRQQTLTLLLAYGCDPDEAAILSDNLVWNALIERNSHGFDRLERLLGRLAQGLIQSPCRPELSRLSPSLSRLDGNNGFGQYLGQLAMQEAIGLARTQGIGAVGVCNSNWNGTGAYFVQLAAGQGLIGLSLSNAYAKVAPHDGTAPVFGTNPLAFGAPRRNGASILLDMASSAISGAELRQSLQAGSSPPTGSVLATPAGAPLLLPFGGHKGSGLALMIEILSAVLSGAKLSAEVASMFHDFDRPGGNGQFFLALDIARFMPLEAYYDRLEALAELIRAAGSQAKSPRLPGERCWQAYTRNQTEGLLLEARLQSSLKKLADAKNLALFQDWTPAPEPGPKSELPGQDLLESSYFPGPGFRIRRDFERAPASLLQRLAAFASPEIADLLNGFYTLAPELRNLVNERSLIGPACTVRIPPNDNLMLHKALDIARPGDILVVDAGGTGSHAVCGDMVSHKARHRGLAGLIIDGLVRDLPGMRQSGLPIFARGLTAAGPFKRGPGEINYPISCGGVAIMPGDVIVADQSGIVAIPRADLAGLVQRLERRAGSTARYAANVAHGDFDNSWVDRHLQDVEDRD
ncbi:MAG: Ldh family oxidoreductase [Candidatus Sericytochromatia bacterium]